MRLVTRLSGAFLPFLFFACGGAPDTPGATEKEPVRSESSSLSAGGGTHIRPDDSNTALVNLACTVAASAAGVPEACAVLSGAETILAFIQGLDSGPSAQQQILSQLNTLNQEMVQVDSDIKNMWTAFNNAAYNIEQTQQLQIQSEIQTHEADARDASVRLSQWVAGGMSDSLLIASIDQESSEAAMALTAQSYYYRGASQAGLPPVLDLRNALLSYLYALSVRLAVITAEDPNYRCQNNPHDFLCTMPYTTELQTHLTFLNSLPGLNASNFSRGHQLQPANNTYALCDYVQDDNSGYIVFADWAGNPPFGEAPANCIGPQVMSSTQANDGMAFLAFWDNWYVEEEMGVHAIEKMAGIVSTDMTYAWPATMPICLPGHSCPPAYSPVGPLVDNNGLCLSAGHGTYPFVSGLYMEPCSQGAEYQTWQTGTIGQTASLGLSDQSSCLETWLWQDYGAQSPSFEPCSGSSGEQYVVTSANELRWSRDQSLCLTSNGGPDSGGYDTYVTLQTCDGQPHQKWGRSWPVLLPIRML